MKKIIKKITMTFLVCAMVFGLAGCGSSESGKSVNTQEVAGDYYIDLTDLGMKLTLYLRLDGEGNFLFSNTLAFEVNKSSGTFQKSGDEYIMVYSSVNGEEKSVSDGLTSAFFVNEEGSLDFTVCERIYYGSSGATSRSEDNPEAILIAHPVTEDFEAPSTESSFKRGTYVADSVEMNGVSYSHTITFYDDNTYLHLISYQDGGQQFASEIGTYGVSGMMVALEPEDGDRLECELVDSKTVKVPVLPYVGASEREGRTFTKTDEVSEVASLEGKGDTFSAALILYNDGSYKSTANGFEETGILVINSAAGIAKQYPDHPETGVRGLAQITTVPVGTFGYENGNMTVGALRVRTSDNLTRSECTVSK